MPSSIPPDLRVLCRKLTSIPPSQLPHALPSLVNHVLRCKKALSTPQDPKPKGDAAEMAMLVHKLKTGINTLVNSRTREARFAAIALIKTAVDVGGWEVIRGSGPWVQGLLSIVQKGDPFAAKELAVVALTRIFVLLQPYQTLVREIATPNIPAFATACLQLIKPSAPDQVTSTPSTVVETVCDALSTLIPLYPATFRPFSSQTQAAVRFFLAPTESDSFDVPASLRQAARRLSTAQHYVAAKSGGSDEWVKLVDGIINELHATADQVLRAVDESWEPTGGNTRSAVELQQEPSGGGSRPDQLPPWTGIPAGSQRIIGLFDYLSTCLRHSTKSPVALPLTKFTDAVSRVCLIARLSPKSQTWDQSLQTRAAVGREEKEELWSSMPDVHIAALRLIQTLFRRLGQDMLPYASESLDHLIRVFNSGIDISTVRSTSYSTLNGILTVAGPTLSKSLVDMLQPAIAATCHDLQEDAGHLKPPSKQALGSVSDNKKKINNGLTANADLFLQKPSSAIEAQANPLEPEHKSAASVLLAAFFTRLPQQHLKPSLRSLLDQTAILTRNRDAMLASVLNPYTDPRGRRFPSILPHLTQQYPEDQSLEVLRTILRTDVASATNEEDLSSVSEDEGGGQDENMSEAEDGHNDESSEKTEDAMKTGTLPSGPKMDLPVQNNPFESKKQPEINTAYSGFGDVQPRASSPPKRKHEDADPEPSKRQELDGSARPMEATTIPVPKPHEPSTGNPEEDDDDSDDSVHLNMELEDDEDDEDED
ncbi:Pre-rRNA-processing protein-like protein [Hapsidospora chrysogenum ATCC 11550]|uniref:Pre-rRNA-processing protein RIX1 n=1 Tax=Hapsidospora chrysogenum (strain ATCC 11550 / CBS 779.69 / DSM 880 / IAM 14645 / JCM 23072 / IMI 49137) TaxID=857340 RepID=A0A086THX6_HAPC1|nr:Pre-rRNA-processing protein-like protein [Hapsidospora chrysogenum ATCC 11550]